MWILLVSLTMILGTICISGNRLSSERINEYLLEGLWINRYSVTNTNIMGMKNFVILSHWVEIDVFADEIR
ncbi:MAG: hypothetical protein AAFQ02_06435 [Bacteroidota bacterium]